MKRWYEFKTVDLVDIVKPDGDVDMEKAKALTEFALNGGVADAIVLWQNGNRLEIVDGRYRVLVSVALGYQKANAYVLHCSREDADNFRRVFRERRIPAIPDGQHRFRGFNFRPSKN